MLKMGVVSVVIALVMVLLYQEENLLFGMLRLEFLIMFLLVFLNQLVLEYYEVRLGDFTNTTFNLPETYRNLGDRVFIWTCILLGISAILNPFALPNILSLLIVSIGLKSILIFRKTFQKNELYRFGADFVFVLLWPVYQLFMFVWNVCLGKF